jgi:hypothetical protein
MREPIDIVLLFDTEDMVSPPEAGSDDSILDLAGAMTEAGLPGVFLVIGDRAKLLGERGRKDVIAAVRRHEVGLHTRSTLHPTNPEMVGGVSWDTGLARVRESEKQGIAWVEEAFGMKACAMSTHWLYACPHALAVAGELGLPYAYGFPACPPMYGVSRYAGALVLPWMSPRMPGEEGVVEPYFDGFDESYTEDAAFEETLARFDNTVQQCYEAGQPFMSTLLYHPLRLRLKDYIERFVVLNGTNLPAEMVGKKFGMPRLYSKGEYENNLRNFRRLLQKIRADKRLRPVTMKEVVAKYGVQATEFSKGELVERAKLVGDGRAIPLGGTMSPAEFVVAGARAVIWADEHGALPERVKREDVLGPTRDPLVAPERLTLSWGELVGACRELLEIVEKTKGLPGNLGVFPDRLGVNHLHFLVAKALVAMDAGAKPEVIKLRDVMRAPELGALIGKRFMDVAEGYYCVPDLDVTPLYRHGKLQTWSLKSWGGA